MDNSLEVRLEAILRNPIRVQQNGKKKYVNIAYSFVLPRWGKSYERVIIFYQAFVPTEQRKYRK